jgi:outer membrane receptor protein involved in Fe transport
LNTVFTTILLVVALAAFAVPAAADTPIDEVLVTVKHRDTPLNEVAAAVVLINAETIAAQDLLTDVFQSSPGVFLQQTTPGQGAAVMRGVRGSAVLHLVDGMRLNNAIFRSAPTQYAALLPTMGIERVEVVRGTQTSLYGSDAIGGVVQVISHKPEFSSASIAMRGQGQLGMDTATDKRQVKLLLDVGNDRHAVSISGEYQDIGDRRIGGGDEISPSDFESAAFRFAYSATPSQETSWFVDLQFLEQPETPRVDELVPGFGQTTPSSSEFFFAPNQRSFAHVNRSTVGGAFGWDWDFDIAWQQIKDDRVTRDYESPIRIREFNRSDLFGITMSAASTAGPIRWILGAEVYVDEVSSSRMSADIGDNAATEVAPRFPDNSSVQQAALYGRLDFDVAARHRLNLGMRLSNVQVEIPETLTVEKATIDATDVSGEIGWVFDATDSVQLVANLGYGFRAPNVFDIGSLGSRPGNRFNVPNVMLQSEYVVQADAGIRFNNARWSTDVVAFTMRYDDRISSVATGDTTPTGREIVQSVNGGISNIHGIEADVRLLWSDRGTARLMLNYTRGDQQLPGRTQEAADRIPPVNGVIEVSYDLTNAFAIEGWLAFAAAQDRLSARDIRDSRINPNGTPGWGSLGVRGSWATSTDWRFVVGVDNVLDKNYRRHGSGIDSVGRNVSATVHKTW